MICKSGNYLYTGLSTGIGFQIWSWSGVELDSGAQLYFADVNGDGRSDLICKAAGNYLYVGLSRENGFQIWSWSGVELDSGAQLYFADVNGDGKTDLICKTGNYLYVGLSRENGFQIWSWSGVELDSGAQLYFADVNGATNGLLFNNLLKKITNVKTDVSTDLTYQKVFDDPNRATTKNYRENIVLSSVTTGNAQFNVTNTMSYENGIYDNLEKEFRGFEKVNVSTLDKDKNVQHITETTFRVGDFTSTDSAGNKLYDQYYYGQTSLVENKIKIGTNDPYTVGKQKYEYEKVNILASNQDVKIVYPKTSKVWMYKDDGTFIGMDSVNGDLSGEITTLDLDTTNGLINKVIQKSYGDPYNANDNIESTTDYKSNTTGANWILVPYKSETKDITNNSRISLKTIYYDNQVEGTVTAGILTSTKAWNNNTSPDKIDRSRVLNTMRRVMSKRSHTPTVYR